MHKAPVRSLVRTAHPHPKKDPPIWLWILDEWVAPAGLMILIVAYALVPQTILPVFAVLCVAGAAIRLQWRTWGRERGAEVGSDSPDETARIICYGSSTELREIKDVPEYTFEPVVVRVFQHGPRSRLLGRVSSRALGESLWALSLFFVGLLLSWTVWQMALLLLTFGGVGPWILRNRKALYYRVSPGRLEMLQSCCMGDVNVCESIPLGSACITIRYDEQWVELRDHNATIIRRIDLGDFACPHRFVTALVQAVVCPVQNPRLPSDQLLG